MITRGIFKANDIRGKVRGEHPGWDADGARTLGVAYVQVAGLEGQGFVLGRDMRTTGEELSLAFAEGAASAGADVVILGLTSTDQLWYASGVANSHGVQFTASHNPPDDNGIKFCLPGAAPVTSDFLVDLADRAFELQEHPAVPAERPGVISHRDTLAGYADYLTSLVPLEGIHRLKVVVDAGNGMAGHTVAAVLGGVDVEIIGLYLDLDGNFPNHQPNPLIPENLLDAQRAVVEHGADLALVFDGDADRCFIIDERGEVVTPSTITALIAEAELEHEPGGTIVVNSVTSRAVAEVVAEHGGHLVTSRVGHTFVKALMAEHNAIFGGEHSAHYYFRDFWGADTGMLAALHVLRLRGHSDEPLSQLVRHFERYANSGELNSTVADTKTCTEAVARHFASRADDISWDDGLRVEGRDSDGEPWWFSLRASNTEPLLRLNVEARAEGVMSVLRHEVLAVVRQNAQ